MCCGKFHMYLREQEKLLIAILVEAQKYRDSKNQTQNPI